MPQKKLAVLLSCTDHYQNRMYLFDEYLQAQGYHTQYLAADFHHNRKESYTCDVPGVKQLHVRPYQKNLSVSRILSHRDFARAAYRYLESLPREPDLIVAEVPPNFLASYMARYKKRHPKVKLVMDLFDLWPETFPSGKAKKLLAPAFAVWAALRNRSLPRADRIITECDLYRRKLGLTEAPNCRVLYLAGNHPTVSRTEVHFPQDCLNLCYLGAINNIIDIPAIAELVGELTAYKPVAVHVIGKGERVEEFLAALESAGARVRYHGAVYDEGEKQAIMAQCHFGLNIMKPTVCIGLTMKSVDYWSFDLPIINNISADTTELVDSWSAGINLRDGAVAQIGSMEPAQLLQMRCNVRRMFDTCFAQPVILERMGSILKEIE